MGDAAKGSFTKNLNPDKTIQRQDSQRISCLPIPGRVLLLRWFEMVAECWVRSAMRAQTTAIKIDRNKPLQGSDLCLLDGGKIVIPQID